MVFLLYNTLTKKKEKFSPLKDNEVRMYVCGPTVNDIPHLGHARSQISFDIIRKYLRYLGYIVVLVSNITDIDDKIISRAKELNEDIASLTKRNMEAHIRDYKVIGVDKPDIQPRATEYINEMILLVKKLEEKGYTYIIGGDGVYFDVSKFKEYGKLSHQKINFLKRNVRKELNEEKKNKEDFVLWKFSKKDEPSWDSPWGKGRPGWHIECSAMSYSILGIPFDIHGGGQDLIFPHHEDEIAQTEAAYGVEMARFWVHNGLVNINKVKMSKSLGNFKTLQDLLKEYSGEVIRYFVISTHYRKPIDFSKKLLENAKNSFLRLKRLVEDIKEDNSENTLYLEKFREAMDEDINTPKALQVLWNLVRDNKATGKIQAIKKIDSVFSLNLLKKEASDIPEEILVLLKKREEARKKGNWGLSDKIREEIKSHGFSLEDTPTGQKVSKI